MGATQLTGSQIKDTSVGVVDINATGTPSSSTYLRGDGQWTGVAVGHITGLGLGVSTFLGTPSSANLLSAVTDETGTGALTFATSPTFTTSVDMTSGGVYKYNAVNMLRAITANNCYFFGPSGNLTMSASNNIFIGTGGTSVTSGGYNVGIGVSALNALTTGSDNLALGVSSLAAVTDGFYNCAFGSSALLNCTSGAANTAFGREALTTNRQGYYNTAIGHNALKVVDLASAGDMHNVGIGAFAGNSITSGLKNTIVGSNSTTGITTGNSNTIIGASVSGLSTTLSNNIILADGDGNIRLQFDNNGLATFAKDVTLATGTTAIAPLRFVSGTNLTSAVAGANEYDGVQFYQTIDTTGGRGAVPVEQYFHLTSAGSNISTIANFFGATSNIPLISSAYYEIEIFMYFTKNTAGAVTFTLTNSSAPTGQNIYFGMSPVTGIVAPPGTASELDGQFYNDNTAAKAFTTASLTNNAVIFCYFKIFLKNGLGTSLKIQATAGAGTITPGIGSMWRCVRRSPNNIGTFAA